MRLEDFLIEEEGNDSRRLPDGRYAATFDPLGRCWNIGPGLTRGVTKSTIWTPAQLAAAEEAEFAATKTGVARLVKVPLGENRMTVCESLAYNIGVSGFAHSDVLRSINAGNFGEVPAHLREYVHCKGVVGPCKGLIKRRNDEIRLWEHPDDVPEPADLKTSKTVPQAFKKETLMASASASVAASATVAASPVIAANPVVAAAVTSSTVSLPSVWSSISGIFSSVTVGGIFSALTLFAPNFIAEILLLVGIAASIVSAIAHGYALITHVSATNNSTISLVENLLNKAETVLGGQPLTFANDPTATS